MNMDIPPAVNEHSLKFSFRPASLKELAATSLALHLWNRNKQRLIHLLTQEIYYAHEEKFSCTDILQSTLPASIREILDKRILSLGRELKNLFQGFSEIGVSLQDFITCFDSITYGLDGKISHEQTARNLMTKNELNWPKKYRIACLYWFEEDVRRISPLVSEHVQLEKRHPNVPIVPILLYWRKKMTKGQLPDNLDIHQLFGANMGLLKTNRNWTAFESVLNTLSIAKQHNALDGLKTFGTDLKYVLSRLNEEQSDFVIRTYPYEIIYILASDEQCFEYVLRIWNLLKDSADFPRFSRLVGELCRRAYRCERGNLWYRINVSDKYKECREESIKVVTVLLEIWSTASNALKTRLLDDDNAIRTIFVSTSLCFYGLNLSHEGLRFADKVCFDHDLTFYSRLFSDMPPETRIRVWNNHWISLALCSQAWFLNSILRLCLVDEGEIQRFVEEQMMNSSQINIIVDAWQHQQLYNAMADYSNLCSWNEHLVQEFRKKFFKPIILSVMVIDNDSLKELSVQIDRQISNIADARAAKRNIFYSNHFQKYLSDKLQEAQTNEVFHLTECFLHTEQSQREKDLFLPYWGKFLVFKTNSDNELKRWQEFLSWWENTDDGWPMFKAFLPVDEVVEKMVLEVVPNLTLWLGPTHLKRSELMPLSNSELKEFAPVDNFLMSYFEYEEKTNRFKWNKVLNYKTSVELTNLFSMNNECIVNDMLRWFFNGDPIGISTFKDRLCAEKQKNDE